MPKWCWITKETQAWAVQPNRFFLQPICVRGPSILRKQRICTSFSPPCPPNLSPLRCLRLMLLSVAQTKQDEDTALHNSSVTVPRVPLPWNISASSISNTADCKQTSAWLTSTPSSAYSSMCKFCPGLHLNISKPTVFFVMHAIHLPIFPGITTACTFPLLCHHQPGDILF